MSAPLCPTCGGERWVIYRSETIEGEMEAAYELCPLCKQDALARRRFHESLNEAFAAIGLTDEGGSNE